MAVKDAEAGQQPAVRHPPATAAQGDGAAQRQSRQLHRPAPAAAAAAAGARPCTRAAGCAGSLHLLFKNLTGFACLHNKSLSPHAPQSCHPFCEPLAIGCGRCTAGIILLGLFECRGQWYRPSAYRP